MNCVSSLLLLSSLFGTAIGCLPGLGLPGAGGGGCCSPAAPSCGSPCGGVPAAPAPIYASAPLAPAPFAGYPQAPPPPPPLPASPQFPQQPIGGGIFPQPVQSGYVASQGGNFQTGALQTGSVAAGGAYLAEPVHQVQPLPLLGQPVAYEKTVVVAPTQQEQVLSTAQVLTKVMPASAVLDEHIVEPAVASPNNVVTSITSQTSYGDEQQNHVFHAAVPASSSSSSSSSSSASSSSDSAEHHPTHQVRVPSASSSVEASERVVPDVVAVKQAVQTFETTPYPQQVALQTAAPYIPAQPHHVVVPQTPVVQQTIVETVQQPVHTIQPIQPAPIQPAPLHPAQHVPSVDVPQTAQTTVHVVPETKVVAVEDRIEAPAGSDYDQPTNVAANEQATVNELLATLDTVNPTVASNLDFNQVTIEPRGNEPALVQTDGDDYDAPLNEDRKDVPTAEPTRHVVQSVSQPVVPEETAPIIPQPIQPIQPVQTYQASTAAPVAIVETTVGYVQPVQPQVHLQPVAPAVRVEVTTAETPLTPAFELPVEVHEVVTPQVPLQPEPATIQTITEQPIAEVTVEVLPTSAAPVSQFFENITSKEDTNEAAPSQPEPAQTAAPATVNGHDYDEEKSVENKVSTENEVIPNLGEYGSKFAKVQGAGTKQVSEPIEIETIENAAPYGRRFWII